MSREPTIVEQNVIAGIFTAISVMLFIFGCLAISGYHSATEANRISYAGFAACFFFLGMFVSPAIKMKPLPDWFNTFRDRYYYLSLVSFTLSIIAGVDAILA